MGDAAHLQAGFASSRRLMLMGLYNMALHKPRLAFMVTTEVEALQGLASSRPGLLIVTEQLEQGSGLALVEGLGDRQIAERLELNDETGVPPKSRTGQ